ncbi:Uncharacterised protein g5117 [Pycnogonum litorale]
MLLSCSGTFAMYRNNEPEVSKSQELLAEQDVDPLVIKQTESLLNQWFSEFRLTGSFDGHRSVQRRSERPPGAAQSILIPNAEGRTRLRHQNKAVRFMIKLLKASLDSRNEEDVTDVDFTWRQKELPLRECPKVENLKMFSCPSQNPRTKEWKCISETELCDGMSHCPNDEDEDPKDCMFYQAVSHVQISTPSSRFNR